MIRIIILAMTLIGCSGCPAPQPPPQPNPPAPLPSGHKTCADVCATAARLGCSWSNQCLDTCANVETNKWTTGVKWNNDCRASATNCAQMDACER